MLRVDRARVDPAAVKCLLRAQFPHWADLPLAAVELGGWDNITFKLGEATSVRLPSADGYALQVEKEHRWLPFLAQNLPLTIPQPLGRGDPGCGFRWPWSIYRWLEGLPATVERVADLTEFAVTLAGFLRRLHSIDSTSGPLAGQHSAFRGGPLSTYDEEARMAMKELADEIDAKAATEVWEEALAAKWRGPPVWVHGDVTPSNLLVVDGRLSAVIDFGCCAVGDPACDTVITWTFLEGPSRTAFQAHLPLDEATWARGRGWALWKALLTHAEARRHRPSRVDSAELRFGWRMDARSLIADLLR